jgi:hypothetical protein
MPTTERTSKTRKKKVTFMDQFMNEEVSLGGTLMTRANVVRTMTAQGHDRGCIDYFAYKPEALSEEEKSPYRAICQCGCRMLSVFDITIDTCLGCDPNM